MRNFLQRFGLFASLIGLLFLGACGGGTTGLEAEVKAKTKGQLLMDAENFIPGAWEHWFSNPDGSSTGIAVMTKDGGTTFCSYNYSSGIDEALSIDATKFVFVITPSEEKCGKLPNSPTKIYVEETATNEYRFLMMFSTALPDLDAAPTTLGLYRCTDDSRLSLSAGDKCPLSAGRWGDNPPAQTSPYAQ
ncbi:MAG: hypothetical protein H6707_16545 [Deltaproteobacteria bacterium]|nr:hypothetical protein [Deltaproteobacteria bacterium]